MSRVRRARPVTVSDHSVVAPGQSDRDRRGSHARQAGAERTALAAGLLLAVSLVCAGCALPGSTSAAADGDEAAADVVRAHGQPQATLDPVAPQSRAPVTRDGKAAGPRVPAAFPSLVTGARLCGATGSRVACGCPCARTTSAAASAAGDGDEAAADVEPGNAHPANTRLTASNSPAASAVRSAPA